MTPEMLQSLLGYCAVINYSVLLLWWLVIAFAHEWIYGLHRRWFELSAETFDAIHYGGIAGFKILVLVFNLAPYIALRFFL